MSSIQPISRRALLRGLGAAVALPWLDAMARPAMALAGAAGKAAPVRMAFLYIPNGAHMEDWTPTGSETEFTLPKILEPLSPFKDQTLILSGLTQDGGRAHGDGPGDHARSLASFLTGSHPRKTAGADIKAGISVDQMAARKIGRNTRLPSLELGCERGAQAGNCDSGYSCAYSSNISWRTESVPMPKEVNPKLVFDRLFGQGPEGGLADSAKSKKYRKSILDFVAEDARDLNARLGTGDRRKLDEYLSAIREIEARIDRAHSPDQEETAPIVDYPRPEGTPKDYKEHIRLMFDLMALAFQTDTTRICTFMYANEGSNRSYPFLDVREGHHELSHHGGDKEKHRKIRDINRFHIEQFAYLLERLKNVKEGESNLLDNVMIVYGSGIGDGNRHNHDDLPILFAGRAGGAVKTGRHLTYPSNTPLNNLYLSMLDRVGAPVDSLGDSKGRLPKLEG
jgi:Protein of unknown function (DUF1552)